MFHVAYGLHESLLVLFVPTWVLHPFEFIRNIGKVCLLCPCSCCACLVNPHISLYHVAFIAVLRVFPYISHWLVDVLINGWVGWLLHWLIEQLCNWLVEWLYRLNWLIDWSFAWLIDWLIDWLTDCVELCRVDVLWLYVCWFDFIGWLIDWYMDRLIDWGLLLVLILV